MSFLKRMLGTLGGRHGRNRNSHHGQTNQHDNYSTTPSASGLNCPRCKISLIPGARFCSQCGSGLENSLCTCGATVAAGAKFCGQCGSSL
ncbi:zinc ribbon domain-containing protein [Legionella pneumophila]|uniref:zinc ribbon domain-containing protein n=1 Tax=Legionella pneumophila TaxID=446 RepID=UPI001A3435FE|nr:zinc ribbon domain-containing protein [Legionella pneumophila]HAT8863267.1 zinc ribbon domain-containing protein [Legionella pneumophila subsp. pneumophila]MCZ4689285.1 zinc ribbon domain-containing protein [Legionella pneumophila]MDW9185282.1 zinc ribbon domain-containing protein [Legionella pneumophila]HAT2053609.1 zinc ribbon domain-containing protein [Legionella pneumophila]HAT8892791.1 zinc ribbon domain-containing protein [Legionella pneumophila subsp. pneumophila]